MDSIERECHTHAGNNGSFNQPLFRIPSEYLGFYVNQSLLLVTQSDEITFFLWKILTNPIRCDTYPHTCMHADISIEKQFSNNMKNDVAVSLVNKWDFSAQFCRRIAASYCRMCDGENSGELSSSHFRIGIGSSALQFVRNFPIP